MNKSIALVIALVLALISVFGIYMWVQREKEESQRGVGQIEVAVLVRAIEAGEALSQEMIEPRQVPKAITDGLPDVILYGAWETFEGQRFSQSIEAGRYLQAGFFPRDSMAFREIRVEKGKRAVSVPAEFIKGVSGLLGQTDNPEVDVIAVYELELEWNKATGEKAQFPFEKIQSSQVIASKVKVLALDDRVLAPDEVGSAMARGGYKSVTLEVTPQQAVEVFHCMTFGKGLFLSLRNLLDNDKSTPPAFTSNDVGENVLWEMATVRQVRQEMAATGTPPQKGAWQREFFRRLMRLWGH